MASLKIKDLFEPLVSSLNSLFYVIDLEARYIKETQVPGTTESQKNQLIRSLALIVKNDVDATRAAIDTIMMSVKEGALFFPLVIYWNIHVLFCISVICFIIFNHRHAC